MKRNVLWTVPAVAVWAAALAGPAACFAGNWPGWRGPTGVGTCGEKDLPLQWNAKTGENVLWKVSLGETTGHSSPIVWGDRVFVTTAARQTGEQEEKKEVPEHHLACYGVADGKLLWRTPIPPGKQPAGYAIYAVPTPVTDGKAVYAWFGSAVIAAVDFGGNILWRKERAGPFNLNPGLCSSPVLYEDTVVLLCDQGGRQGWLHGIDKKTGEVRWEQKRADVSHNNTTPVLLPVNGKTQLIVAGSNVLQGLDPADGRPIWWCKSWGFGPSPAYGSGLLYVDKACDEPGLAVDPTGQGDVTQTHVKWQHPKVPGEYGSPVICGDYVYRPDRTGRILCWRLSTGEPLYAAELQDLAKLPSPVATADGRVYFVSPGKSYVVKAGPTLEVLGTGDLGGDTGNGSSPAVSEGRIFVRDGGSLFCIGRK